MTHNKGSNSSRMKGWLNNLPNAIAKVQKPPLILAVAEIEDSYEVESDDLEGHGVFKIIIPSNIIDIYTRLEVLQGLKLSSHIDSPTESSNVIDELCKKEEIQKNNNTEVLLMNFVYNKGNYLANFYDKLHLIRDLKLNSMC